MSIEIMQQLRDREKIGLSADQIIDLCFSAIEEIDNKVEQSRAAVILSGIVQEGLGIRTQELLDERPDLPERVHQILRASILRMEGF